MIFWPFFLIFSAGCRTTTLLLVSADATELDLWLLKQRLNNLEEPTWTSSHDEARWDLCRNNASPCSCLSDSKYVTCRITGSLSRDIKIPWEVEILEFVRSELNGLSPRAFDDFPRLGELIMSDTDLNHISRHTFDRVTNLRHLILSRNDFSYMSFKIFKFLTKLEKLDLSQNRLTEFPSFNTNTNLTYLHLDLNKLDQIMFNTFHGLENLKHLYLSNNNIKWVGDESFAHLKRLEELHMSDNLFSLLSFLQTEALRHLKELHLAGNQIARIEGNPFQFLHSLQVLNLEKNKLKEFDFSVVPNGLETLNLHKNYLSILSMSPDKINLSYLDLSGNNIEVIPRGIFANMNKLNFINLSNNMLKSLEFYSSLPTSVHKLDVRTNLMETLADQAGNLIDLSHLDAVQGIYLSQNLWQCSCTFKHILEHFEFIISDLDVIDCEDSPGTFKSIRSAVVDMKC